jgi:hypothetical protein
LSVRREYHRAAVVLWDTADAGLPWLPLLAQPTRTSAPAATIAVSFICSARLPMLRGRGSTRGSSALPDRWRPEPTFLDHYRCTHRPTSREFVTTPDRRITWQLGVTGVELIAKGNRRGVGATRQAVGGRGPSR